MEIFVFGSNLQGTHGGGAAKDALDKYGAIWGQGEGRQGNSYALPTKRNTSESLTLDEVKGHVAKFISYATDHPDEKFFVTAVGCGLAGFAVDDIAPMFEGTPDNCRLHERFTEFFNKKQGE